MAGGLTDPDRDVSVSAFLGRSSGRGAGRWVEREHEPASKIRLAATCPFHKSRDLLSSRERETRPAAKSPIQV